MIDQELKYILTELRDLPKETEVVEFKKAKNDFDFARLGQYFSALSNEANLKGIENAWLVFGVEDQTHRITGTNYRLEGKRDLRSLKREIADKTTDRITFKDIHVLTLSEGRVIMFQIPPAPKGIPVAFKNHYYGRDDESIGGLSLEKIERIRSQNQREDWSAVIIPNALIEDLDQEAIDLARKNYKNKFPDKANDLETWDDIKFLNKAKVTIKGKITRTAIILLGKDESDYLINPAVAKIRWLLKDANNNDKDYDIFGCPLILAVDKVYAKIRNLKYRYIKDGSLFPEEVTQYESYSIREALNNCIAHQDYAKHGRINVVEKEDELIFTNLGAFIPGSVERAVEEDAPPEQYRNPFLATAMFNLKMVDTAGGGIRKMFNYQRERYFPMPDYDLSKGRVKVALSGKIIDMDYARLLASNNSLSLSESIMLDKVQKEKEITKDEAAHLRKKKLIEGRRPNYYISLKVAQNTGQKAVYTRTKGFEKEYYIDLIIKAIKQHKSLTRKEVDELLWEKLPDWMSEKQKKNKVNNLLSELRRKNNIKNEGTNKIPQWVLIN